MKVAISSSGTTVESEVDLRFGRCPYYIIYDTEAESFEHVEIRAVRQWEVRVFKQRKWFLI